MIEAFITWKDGTASTITARDWGDLDTQIKSTPKELEAMEAHLIELKNMRQGRYTA